MTRSARCLTGVVVVCGLLGAVQVAGEFVRPMVVLGLVGGRLLGADEGNHRIQEFDATGAVWVSERLGHQLRRVVLAGSTHSMKGSHRCPTRCSNRAIQPRRVPMAISRRTGWRRPHVRFGHRRAERSANSGRDRHPVERHQVRVLASFRSWGRRSR